MVNLRNRFSNCSFSAVKRSFSMIFGANFRIFCEIFYRTFKTVIDSDYDSPKSGMNSYRQTSVVSVSSKDVDNMREAPKKR